jgi:myosin-15
LFGLYPIQVANVYFKSHLWQMKREPIKTPFLSKSKESDYQESLAIFKLILRFMNDNNLSGLREKVLSDYIVNKGLRNEKLRDEIFCQLANQTWKNDNDENRERGWLLMANCLSAFPPSKMMFKYLLKYVSDHGHNGYKPLCQRKLLKVMPNGRFRDLFIFAQAMTIVAFMGDMQRKSLLVQHLTIQFFT